MILKQGAADSHENPEWIIPNNTDAATGRRCCNLNKSRGLDLPVYAFDGTTYSGYSGTTDTSGRITFTLPQGSYRFRADLNGTQFWSNAQNDCTIPGCTSDAITVTLPVTITVTNTDGTAQTGLPVYAFAGTTYADYKSTTDANGQVSLTLPQGSYRFRADLNGTQFWSSATDTCTLPGCATASITVTKPLILTVQGQTGQPYPNLPVYAFNGTTYTGYNGTTDTSGHVTFTLPQGSYRFRADLNGTPFWSSTQNDCTVPGCTTATVTLPSSITQQTVTINYTYDALNRLTAANYSDPNNPGAGGNAFAYVYDAAGNVLHYTQTTGTLNVTTTYTYDFANQLATGQLGSASAVHYAYDADGNLLSNGVNTYTYNSADQLTGFNGQGVHASFAYDGLGDRLQQTIGGVPTNYVVDINNSLPQVLQDGTDSYIYGVGNLAQINGSTTDYFLTDALGSTRQLVNADDQLTLAENYDPFGNTIGSTGSDSSIFGFTGQQTDRTGLQFLRARYYDPYLNQFIQPDIIVPDPTVPEDWNRYLYTRDNPVNYTDPSGHDPSPTGYFEGVSYAAGFVQGGAIAGQEIVYDYATMTRARFNYTGTAGGLFASIGVAVYAGQAWGFRYEFRPNTSSGFPLPLPSTLIEDDYKGWFDGAYAGPSLNDIGVPLSVGAGYFQSSTSKVKGFFLYTSLSAGLLPFEVVGFHTNYSLDSASLPGYLHTGIDYYYDPNTGQVNTGRLISDILTGDHSPIPGGEAAFVATERANQIENALIAAYMFEQYYQQPVQCINPIITTP